MIDFGEDYIQVIDRPVTVTFKDLGKKLGEFISAVGEEYEVSHYESYHKFKREAVNIAPRFFSRRIPLDVQVQIISGKTQDEEEEVIEVSGIFPSGVLEPFIEYYTSQKEVSYPLDPTSPYSILVRAVRKGGMSKKSDKRLAYNILNKMSDSGTISGRRVIDLKDVELFRRVLSEFEVKKP